MLFGLCTDGDAVAYADEMDHNLDWHTMLDFTSLEVELTVINGHGRISICYSSELSSTTTFTSSRYC